MLTYKNSHIKYGLITQVVIIGFFLWFLFLSILPKYWLIEQKVGEVNTLLDEYKNIEIKGVPFSSLANVAKRRERAEVIRLTEQLPKETEQAITKSWSSDLTYEVWLKQEKEKAFSEKETISQKFAVLNSILPTLHANEIFEVPEDAITLTSLIKYVEGSVLGKHAIISLSPIGIQSISFTESEILKKYGAQTGAIWYFDIFLEIEWRNSDIEIMIQNIESSGNRGTGAISEELSDEKPPVMSNPLITIESLSLNTNITRENQGDMNQWQIILRFYVRWASTRDIEAVKSAIIEKTSKLQKDIQAMKKQCIDKQNNCSEIFALEVAINDHKKNENAFMATGGNEVTKLNILSQVTNSITTISDKFETYKALNMNIMDFEPLNQNSASGSINTHTGNLQ